MEVADTWEEFEKLHSKSSFKKKQIAEPTQEKVEEPMSDFDRILLGIMSVSKSELDKPEE